jgi:hypothetical protein
LIFGKRVVVSAPPSAILCAPSRRKNAPVTSNIQAIEADAITLQGERRDDVEISATVGSGVTAEAA